MANSRIFELRHNYYLVRLELRDGGIETAGFYSRSQSVDSVVDQAVSRTKSFLRAKQILPKNVLTASLRQTVLEEIVVVCDITNRI